MTCLNAFVNVAQLRLFLIFIYKFTELGFLSDLKDPGNSEKRIPSPVSFSEDDDLDLCLYYLRSLSNVLRASGETSWNVLASRHVSLTGPQLRISCKCPHVPISGFTPLTISKLVEKRVI